MKWRNVSIPEEYLNGLEYLGKQKGISAAAQLRILLNELKVPQLSDKELQERLKVLEAVVRQ
jgi:hypothetical protein